MTDKYCFSCGTDCADWIDHNCDNATCPCIKRQRVYEDGNVGPFYCSVQKHIVTQYLGGGKVSDKAYEAAQHYDCPYKQTEYPKRKPTVKTDNQPNLFEI